MIKLKGDNVTVTDNRFRELDKRQIFKDSVAKKDEKKDRDKDKGKGDKKY